VVSEQVLDIRLELAALARRMKPHISAGTLGDLLATLVVHDKLVDAQHVCELHVPGNAQQACAWLGLQHKGTAVTARVYGDPRPSPEPGVAHRVYPFAAAPRADIHIVTYVHVDEPEQHAHIHVVGWLTLSADAWKKPLDTAPPGGSLDVPLSELRPFSSLLQIADRRNA
jgi:hypothetical protein